MQNLITRCKINHKNAFVRHISTNITKNKEFGVAYDPKVPEDDEFESKDYFRSEIRNGKNFNLILPPPNITGVLHLGHALAVTIQDVLVRWHRMRGYNTVWVPGIDHAGIATQVVVEKKLWKEKGLNRYDLGRKAFEEEVWKWKEEKEEIICRQLRRMGASPDWPRRTFTMDRTQSVAVTEAFIKLYEAGLIYRSDYLVNWSCVLRSAISDVEVDHVAVDGRTALRVPGYDEPVVFGQLWRFAYKLRDPAVEADEEIVVATTRPETMLGDVAVAVNPKDARYSRFIGKSVWHPFRNEGIPIIADDFVDPNFGTGAVKVTPAHDHADFEAGRRHRLRSIRAIDEDGRINGSSGGDLFAGLRRFEARPAVLSELGKEGLLRGSADHRMSVPICGRSGDVVEFLARPQWFVKCAEMAAEAVKDYREGRLTIEPERFGKDWINWLENIRDWCVSRQLWWGHRVPVYFCGRPGEDGRESPVAVAARDLEDARSKASVALGCAPAAVRVVRDEDVLDTWFSSALLPFSSHGWPQQTEDLQKHYPLSIMETGHDILFFWVARMVMLGKKLTGQLPFSNVLLHGIVCDNYGRKMSKSLGNVVDPEDVIDGKSLPALEEDLRKNHIAGILSEEELQKALIGQKKMFPEGIPQCGADALRFTLCSHNIKNHFINFDVQECKTNKFFGNKIWQAVKFANKWIQTVSAAQTFTEIKYESLGLMDKWILSRLSTTIKTIDESIEKYEFHTSTAALKNFMYFDFCDVYLECVKRDLRSSTSQDAAGHCWTMAVSMDAGLRCLAPFMPALARYLHERLEAFPLAERRFDFPREEPQWSRPEIEAEVGRIMEVVVSIRRLKKLFNVTAKHKPKAILVTEDPDRYSRLVAVARDLSGCETLEVRRDADLGDDVATTTVADRAVDGVTVRLVVPDELRRGLEVDARQLERKRARLAAELERVARATSADAYLANATEEAKAANARKISSLQEKITRIDYIRSLI